MDVALSRLTQAMRVRTLVQIGGESSIVSQSRSTFIVPANSKHRFQYSQHKMDDEKLII